MNTTHTSSAKISKVFVYDGDKIPGLIVSKDAGHKCYLCNGPIGNPDKYLKIGCLLSRSKKPSRLARIHWVELCHKCNKPIIEMFDRGR